MGDWNWLGEAYMHGVEYAISFARGMGELKDV